MLSCLDAAVLDSVVDVVVKVGGSGVWLEWPRLIEICAAEIARTCIQYSSGVLS